MPKQWTWTLGLSLMLGLLLNSNTAIAQSLTGTTSLITIPIGEIPADSTFFFGGGFVNKKYSDYQGGLFHYTPYFISVVYLPFLEVSFRFSRPIANEEIQRQNLGDRMVSARLLLLQEHEKRPGVVVGVHDFLSSSGNRTTFFNALYMVATKHVNVAPLAHPVSLHLGYGTKLMEAHAHQFVGVFGGLSVTPFHTLDVLLEYDGNVVNIGQRVTLFGFLQLLIALQNFDTFAGGTTFMLKL